MREIVYMFPPDQAPHWFAPAWPQGYPVSCYDPDRNYSADTVFYYDMYGPFQETICQHLARGHRVIYDAKNEHYLHPDKQWLIDAFYQYPGQGAFVISGHAPKSMPGIQVFATPYWYWIIDQISFLNYNYNNYTRLPTNQHKFFMQMSLQRPDRDQLWKLIQPIRHLGLYSYKSQGIHLPNDVDPDSVHNWQRYMNWEWINSCATTLVVESNIDDNYHGISITENNNLFLCEKTYKPLAYGHAFLLASTRNNLQQVREQGFETFPELWDESYDSLWDYQDRVRAIVEIIKRFDAASLDNPVVQQKIQHNRDRFFNKDLTAKYLLETIVQPVIDFANA